jgi:hypothetical protein
MALFEIIWASKKGGLTLKKLTYLLLTAGLLLTPLAHSEDEPLRAAGPLLFKPDASWKETPVTSSMRAAQFSVPAAGEAGEDGEVVVFHFAPGQGGDVAANVERWQSQFAEPAKKEISEMTIDGRVATVVTLSGTYLGGSMMMPATPEKPKPDYTLQVAIVPSDKGNVFFRFTGPSALVERNGGAFKRVIESARFS